MKVGGGVVYGAPRATALPKLLLGHGRNKLRCFASSSSSSPGIGSNPYICVFQTQWKCTIITFVLCVNT